VSVVHTGGSWDGEANREDDLVYVNIETGGIKVYDVADITAPVEVASYDMLNEARAITPRNGYAYVAEKSGGFTIYRNDLVVSVDNETVNPVSFALKQNYPNPFNPSTSISYTITQNNDVKLEIINLTGQIVNTLVNTKQHIGTYSVEWDGRKINGEKVTSGIYLYRLSVGEEMQSKKMVLVK